MIEKPDTPLFFKRDGGVGEGKKLFSREKKFFPSPEYHPYQKERVVMK
jgi:hypothetical protein